MEKFALTRLRDPVSLKEGKIPIRRKLSLVLDKESKVRVIAILDYWTQTALRPLHYLILEVLKKFKADCTFDQGKR
jgi:hypothetical protein